MSEENPPQRRLPGKLSASRLDIFNTPPRSPSEKKKTTEKPKILSPKPDIPPKRITQPLSKETTMPDNQIFHSPMMLISTVDGKATCNQSTLTKLREIEKPLNIVSVVGTLRTGKSFILNKLASHSSAGDKSWFETGHTTTAVTKGIWVMCRPHPTQEDQVLVLLDTEGIDDPDKVDIEDDKNLFVLATLLSSTMVYNTRGNFDRTAIDKFKFLNRIKTSIKVSGSEEDDSILDFFFPNFVLTLRDVTLESNEEDDDTYLEDKLKLKRRKKGEIIKEDSLKEYNLPRMLIRRYFKNRKCFRFRKPVKRDLLKMLMTLPENTLKRDFQEKLNEFRNYIYSCEPKLLKSGKAINGRMLSSLLLNYVHSIQVGESPCLTSAMISMSTVENTHVVQKASEIYKREMQRRLTSYSPSEKGLVNYHKDSMKAALEVLKSGLIIDDEQIYEEQAMVCFKNQFEKFKSVVKKDLEAKCLDTLGRLDTMKIQVKIKNRKYCTPTGYDDYMEDIDSLIQQFNREVGYMGSVARIVLQDFLEKKVEEEEIVYKMVLEALDGQEGPARKKIKPLSMCREEDANILKAEEEVEEAIRADIEMLQVNGLQNIGTQYLCMLKTKIEEVDRVKKELTPSNPYYRKLCKETIHWKNIVDKAAFRKQLKRVTEQNDPWDDVIGPLWKKALEKDESIDEDDVTSQCSFDEEDFKPAKEESTSGDSLTILPDRVSPEGMSDDQVCRDPVPVEERRKSDKCNII
ncbi:guanylate-binding protein 2-like isoform X2 [Mercenaria mercenaria]|uniref:guanylate-binding protein 2-like isoform X2 n=1 Tax=Mercenaria mercenaria TaxID=6596 RepID=UPI00234F0FF6|nr:guanylate-binding protein 2-like isoform X2 [Mercenaria mercenaria]